MTVRYTASSRLIWGRIRLVHREPADGEGEADLVGEAGVPPLAEEGSGAGWVAVSEVRVAERPSSSSPDPAEPTGSRCTREPCDPVCLLPHAGAWATELLRIGHEGVP